MLYGALVVVILLLGIAVRAVDDVGWHVGELALLPALLQFAEHRVIHLRCSLHEGHLVGRSPPVIVLRRSTAKTCVVRL